MAGVKTSAVWTNTRPAKGVEPWAGNIRERVRAIVPAIVEIRHRLHRNPELADQEHATAALVRKALRATAARLLPPFLGTDVVGLLQGATRGRNVTLRADMDALPLAEKTGLPYRSRKPGLMHACGHDGHTAMLIGAAWVLSGLRRRFAGSVRFVFQPGEELAASGKALVAKGALRDPAPDAVLALHGWNQLPVGVLGAKAGPAMAAADAFQIVVKGKGGHAAYPHLVTDPIVTAAQIVAQLQTVVARRLPPLAPAVLSVCRFQAGANGNVIPDTAELEGTIRYLDAKIGERIGRQVEQIVEGVCAAAGAHYELRFTRVYIPTVNDRRVVALGRRVAKGALGKAFWRDVAEPSMGAEDFAYYLQGNPGAIFRLGLGDSTAPLHSPQFDFNDAALENGMTFLVEAALASLAAPR